MQLVFVGFTWPPGVSTRCHHYSKREFHRLDRNTKDVFVSQHNHPSNLPRPPNASDQPLQRPKSPPKNHLFTLKNHKPQQWLSSAQEEKQKKTKVTYLHDVHDGERLLQQGVGVENFGGGSLHATMRRRNLQFWRVTFPSSCCVSEIFFLLPSFSQN